VSSEGSSAAGSGVDDSSAAGAVDADSGEGPSEAFCSST